MTAARHRRPVDLANLAVITLLATIVALALLSIVLSGGRPPEAPLTGYGCRVETSRPVEVDYEVDLSSVLICVRPADR